MKEIDKIISLYFDGQLTEQQKHALSDWLKQDHSHIEWFVRECYIYRNAYDLLNGQTTQSILTADEGGKSLLSMDFWEELSKEEKTAETIELPEKERHRELVEKVVCPQKEKRKMTKFQIFTTIVSAAALLFIIAFPKIIPSNYDVEVATLMDAIDAEWSGSTISAVKPGSRLLARDGILQLKKGVVKIEYDNGTVVIVEAPGKFEIATHDQIDLLDGRVYAKMAKGTSGFIVSTPNSKVIDLGTEFGVQVNANGSTDVHVFEGSVSLIPRAYSGSSHSQVVTEGQARTVVNHAGNIQAIEFATKTFVREINSRTKIVMRGQSIDLADIVGGGNGFGTGTIGVRIDPRTGTRMETMDIDAIVPESSYTVVEESPYIDGVFIPDPKSGPVQVSSTGLLFEDCPDTLGATHFGPFNGNMQYKKEGGKAIPFSIKLNGKLYGTKQNPSIMIVSNMGITFDLDAIRKSLPAGMRITGFSCVCGLPDAEGRNDLSEALTDFHVLVDGKERFSAIDVQSGPPYKHVNLKLEDESFLTLMATDGSDKSYRGDWAIFAVPELVIERIN